METRDHTEVIIKNQGLFHTVVPFDPAKNKLLAIDLTSANIELTSTLLNDTKLFTNYINEKLNSVKARYGIGGYGELRTVYEKNKLFDAENPGEEPRRLHLGVDIWGRPLTPVMAPYHGIVHSFAFNDRAGDYGATIILTHSLERTSFYTLYGHLSLSSIKNIQPGERVKTGDIIGEFGIPLENGHWPPHLHFQVIIDIGNFKGDYPGVCKFSEKEKYLKNSPDPELILKLERYLK